MRSTLSQFAGRIVAALLLIALGALLGLPQDLREAWLDGRHAASEAAADLAWRIQHGGMY